MLKTNIKNKYKAKVLAFASLVALVSLSIAGSLSAQTLNQGYSADEPLQNGMVVKQKADDSTKVEPLTKDTLKDIKGVVVAKNDSPVVIASSDQNVFVSDNGTHDILVSDENGVIKAGDYLSISSVNGVAMKATSSQPIIAGRALAEFNGQDNTIGSTARQADNKRINLGRIQADIAIGANPWEKRTKTQTVPKILKDVSSSVAGRPVTNARIWLASIVFLVSSFVTGVMLYAGAKNSLLALGRNPLSKTSILRGLLQVVILGLTVFICGMFGVYLLLKL